MPLSGLERFKPASAVRTRLFAAALTWSLVGAALLVVGSRWTLAGDDAAAWITLVPALALGLLKARVVLAPRAAANARRIVAAGEGRCVGGFLGWSSWALVLAMVILGAMLRRSPVPRFWLGAVYVAVGAALLAASAASWRRWRDHGRGAGHGRPGPRATPRA